MPQDHSLDLVSKVNMQELRNAVSQAQKEISTRFDFRGSSASLEFEESSLIVKVAGDHQAQLRSVIDVFETKMAKRGVAVNSLAWKEPEQLPSGGMKRQATVQQGIPSEKARELVAHIKSLGLKVQPRIEGETVRVSAKQIDDLQAVIQAVKTTSFGIPIQAENYR
jgi:uncharacterized protein YajQ (UPF0234 family)